MATINCKAPKAGNREGSYTYDFGADLESAQIMFGDAVVFSQYLAASKVDVQALIRRHMEAGKTDEEIQTYLDTYKLGVKAERVAADPLAAFLNKFPTMSAEEQADIISKLQAKLGMAPTE
jgi:hypothetical protein